MKKTLSIILSLVLAISACLGTFETVFADGEETAEATLLATAEPTEDETKDDTDNAAEPTGTEDEKTEDEDKAATDPSLILPKKSTEDIADDYCNTIYLTAEEKLYDMKLETSAYGYELYCDEFSGEVAVKDTRTGRMLFTNPFDVFSTQSTNEIKKQILSQIKLTYCASDGEEKEMYSFNEAISKGQIKVKPLKDGIRIEYAIGEEETRYLVPRLISKDRYEALIKPLIDACGDSFVKGKFDTFYELEDPSDETLSANEIDQMHTKFPITEKMPVYVFDANAKPRELRMIQNYIKQYCPNYSYATLQEDHDITGYTVTDKDPPLFRMALEYTLDEDGLTYRLPANGIRFNSDEYQLLKLQVLPYFGAGSSQSAVQNLETETPVPYTGYTFIPDGSGALFRFEDLRTQSETKTGRIYGTDYTYHDIGLIKQETMRLPVFGVVENFVGNEANVYEKWFEAEMNEETGVYTPEGMRKVADYTPLEQGRGYVGIIEDGDSLVSVTTSHGGGVHKYNTVYAEFSPRPTDEYSLADTISAGDNTPVKIASKRKFTGSYKVRAIMLTDDETAAKAGLSEDEYYECSYVGMAKAYRKYLEKTGVLTRAEKTDKDIPLYIESFGAIETDSTFLTFPTTEMVALTSFDNIRTMYDQLAEKGITNINFRLKGYGEGGIYYGVPNGFKVEKVVGGEDGFKDLLAYAKEKGFGVYPEFDFVYEQAYRSGFKYSTDAAKTIDGRYIAKRTYTSSLQATVMFGGYCVSPSVFDKYYANLKKDLDKYDITGISAGTLGSDLNSDFDKKEPYNREDSKQIVQQLLAKMKEDYGNVMVDGGNAYSFASANHILGVTLDSSHFNNSAYSVPFVGLVLHGYTNFAGKPTNMASDVGYETLKMIENGSLPYFTLSYQNTPLLKETSDYSKYYSVAYDIWVDDLVELYTKLNGLLKDLQSETIENHEFITGRRVPTDDEIESDAAEAQAAAEAKAAEEAAKADVEARAALLAQRLGGKPVTVEDDDEEDVDETVQVTETETAEPETPEEVVPVQEENDKYTVNDGSIVKITYSNGATFILNYNRFAVTAEGQTIEPLGFMRIG